METTFTTIEKDVIRKLCKDYLKTHENLEDRKKDGLNEIIAKCENSATVVPILSEERRKYINEIVDMCRDLIQEYSDMLGDMSLVNEYDDIKKKGLILSYNLADISAELKVNTDISEYKLKSLRAEIATAFIEQGKSVGYAENASRTDPTYLQAVEDYRVYATLSNKVKTTYAVMENLNKSVVQSISMARTGMVKESYQN